MKMNNGGNVQYRIVKGYDRGEEVGVRVPDLNHHSERWRADYLGTYYYVNSVLSVWSEYDFRQFANDAHYASGNYFKTEEEAQRAAEYLKECLTKYHDNE